MEKRESLESGLMVLAFTGSVGLRKAVGSSHLWVGGKLCKRSHYYEFSDSTRYTNCQLYGNPPTRCREETPMCAVCAKLHEARLHPCGIPTCNHGPMCTYPPIMCRACQQLHKGKS
jgi:hypothetical protein